MSNLSSPFIPCTNDALSTFIRANYAALSKEFFEVWAPNITKPKLMFQWDPSLFDLAELDTLPTVIHEYKTTTELDSSFVWLSYAGLEAGNEISFSRNTNRHAPQVTNYVVRYLQQFFKFQLNPERVHFIRTSGEVPPHRDELRKCCVNIGLKNCGLSTTFVSEAKELEDFDAMKVPMVVEDGAVYLMKTATVHSVSGPVAPRLLLTYGFGAPYETILGNMK